METQQEIRDFAAFTPGTYRSSFMECNVTLRARTSADHGGTMRGTPYRHRVEINRPREHRPFERVIEVRYMSDEQVSAYLRKIDARQVVEIVES